jgi:hypothetical protein
VPALLALSTLAGLLAGLLGDGPWDAVGWCALGLPLAVALRCLWRGGGGGGSAAAVASRARAGRL